MVKLPELPPLVEIFWEDHYSIGDDWHEPGHRHQPCVLSAVGYMVSEDEMYYYVSGTYELDTGKYQGGTAVLKNCVVLFRTYNKGQVVAENKQKPHPTGSKKIRTTQRK